jgi:RimJ/RimL family protein N-acetyltransferase
MKIFTESNRLILREILPDDAQSLFLLDSDPRVHCFLGNNPIKTLEEARHIVQFIRRQYVDNGIGRWAVIDKESNEFIGWSGLKFVTEETNNHINYYDLGYRFIKKYWGKGYATEAASVSLHYAFNELKTQKVFAMADSRNLVSKNVLLKVGLEVTGTFTHQGQEHYWFEVDKEMWDETKSDTRKIC